ncbi:MAG TPA: thioredoxin family protein [Acidobacteriaceae bacterium]|jgi:peroxiredoxin|nr:thioredoxin family protein [Acidobacteriaceae bacterium]
MAATESAMLELGTQAPHFSLKEVRDGKVRTSEELAGPKGLLVMFICAHCPFVQHVERELAEVGKDYKNSGVGVVAISSNDAENYPGDAPAGLAAQAEKLRFVFPYLYDETQAVARAYDARCTPDFFLFDGTGRLVYRGQLDASRPGNGVPVTGKDLRAALDALVAGRSISTDQYPSIGCNIKWK